MAHTQKSYSTTSNMLFCLRSTAEYIPSLLLWTALSIAVKVAVPVLEMYIPKIVITEITNNRQILSAGQLSAVQSTSSVHNLPTASWQSLAVIVLAATLLLALIGAFSKYCERCVYDKKNMIGLYYIRKIAHKGLTTDFANREADAFRALQQESYQMCQGNETTLRNVYYSWIGFFAGIIGFAFYSAILTQLNAAILLFLVVSTSANYVLSRGVVKWASENSAERTKYHHKLGYVDSVAEDVKSAKDIRLYNMEPWLQRVYGDNISKIAHWYKRYDKLVLKTTFGNSAISLLREGVAYGYLIYLALGGQIGAGDFVLFFAAITGFSGWLQSVIGQIAEMNRCSAYISKYRSYLDYPDAFRREGGASVKGMLSAPRTIELRNVRYRYTGAESDALRDINLTIGQGEHIGVVGLNGAGKTTLVKLICGLIDPSGGEVLYDGVNVKDYNRFEFYKLFSAVFQQHSLLALPINEVVAETAADNANADRVASCLMTAGLWDKVSSLPNGADTPYDKSINDVAAVFSGGETQKLLLARAIYKDAPILLLDEPTAALDPVAENKLYENYHGITGGKTSVFISHRLASTRFCDRILLLNNGKIEETGTHAELLQDKKLYCSLFETQAKYYREQPELPEQPEQPELPEGGEPHYDEE